MAIIASLFGNIEPIRCTLKPFNRYGCLCNPGKTVPCRSQGWGKSNKNQEYNVSRIYFMSTWGVAFVPNTIGIKNVNRSYIVLFCSIIILFP